MKDKRILYFAYALVAIYVYKQYVGYQKNKKLYNV